MAVEIINSPDASTVNDAKKFTGVIPYNVIAINPTKQQLHDVGLTFVKTEPVYQREFDTEEGKRKSTIVDVWLKSVPNPKYPDMDMVTKLTFFINNDPFVSAGTGKNQYINKYGRTAWAASVDELNSNPYYINDDSREGYRGEEDLYKFLFAWLNMTYDAERKVFNPCRLDVKKLFAGDYSELQDIVTQASAYVVKVLTGVRKVEGDDGTIRYYATTYNKYFLKHNQKSFESIKKFIEKSDYNDFRDAEYFTYEVKEFDASVIPDAEPSMSVGASSGSTTSSDPF